MGDRKWGRGLFLSQSRYLKVARKVVLNGGNYGLDEFQKDHQVLMHAQLVRLLLLLRLAAILLLLVTGG